MLEKIQQMKRTSKKTIGVGFILIILLIIGFFIPARVDNAKSHSFAIHSNLQTSDDLYPTINKLIDDVHDDGERVVFYPDISKEILNIFDVKFLDISGGRLFFLREKRNLWGRNRTFILHRDVSRPIIIDNSSSQDSRLTWLANRQGTFNDVKNLDQSPDASGAVPNNSD